MWKILSIRIFGIISIFSCFSVYAASQLNVTEIEKLTGAHGQLESQENVFKVSVPRNDLSVTIAGVKIVPAMGTTSWAAFKNVGDHTIVMGDMVLTENQVNPVMSTALNNGLSVTALHNHFFWDHPHLMFMHIEGMGNEMNLAKAIGKVFAKIKATTHVTAPESTIDPAHTTLNPKKIETILNAKGTLTNGVFKVVIGRTTHMNGHVVGSTMGVNTWAVFVGSDDHAVVDGDFAMRESELQNVLKTLRNAGIYIVAIHQHMTNEQPRTLFLHYWGIGSTEQLAKALRAALNQASDKQQNARTPAKKE